MQLTHDDFDTTTLAVPSYKTTIVSKDEVSDLSETISRMTEGFITCFTPFNTAIHSQLSAIGFALVSLRAEYHFKGNPIDNGTKTNVFIWDQLQYPKNFSSQDWDAVIAPVAAVSRYARDRYLDRKAAYSIYHHWIINSLHGYASHVFCAEIEGILAGVLTLKPKGKRLFIDLFSVDAGFQSQGVGSALLGHVLSGVSNPSALSVVTEGENIGANRLYQRHGFHIYSLQCVYHYHCSSRRDSP